MTNNRKAFVLMPFSEPFNSYYAAIFQPALRAAGFTALRADDIYTPRPIILDINEGIVNADLILCEMTGRSPNVFYELGLAHAVGKPAILLSRKSDDIPFDLRHVRVILYETEKAGWEDRLRTEIEKAARASITAAGTWPPPLVAAQAAATDREERLAAKARWAGETGEPHVVDRPLNLGFDGAIEMGFPHGWFDSQGYVSGVSSNCRVRVIERDDNAVGKCLMLQQTSAGPHEFCSVMQRFPGYFLAGRTVRLEGELCSQNVTGWVGLWLRADGKEAPDLFFDNMSSQRVTGTTPWKLYCIEAKLPTSTHWVNLGIVFNGSGIVWADNLRFLRWTNEGNWIDV